MIHEYWIEVSAGTFSEGLGDGFRPKGSLYRESILCERDVGWQNQIFERSSFEKCKNTFLWYGMLYMHMRIKSMLSNTSTGVLDAQ